MSNVKEVPVFLFTGFLESGKTKFIQETLEDKRFNSGERTLLVVCEEGEEEYAPDKFSAPNVFMVTVEEPEELTREAFRKWLDQYKCERCVIEYNGMWMLDDLYQALPEMWMVYQEFFFADARSILSYNANMRNLVYDKLKSAELTVFNRYNDSIDQMELHKLVRAASARSSTTRSKIPCRLTSTRPLSRSATTTTPSGTATCPRSRKSTKTRSLSSNAAI